MRSDLGTDSAPPAIRSAIGRRAFLQRLISLTAIFPFAHRISKAIAAPVDSLAAVSEIVALPVKYPGSGATLQGYLARPAGMGAFPAVILEGRFALGDPLREAAHGHARAGFVAFVMDPLSRQGGAASFPSPEASRQAYTAISPAQRSVDLNSARRFLQSHPSVLRDQIRVAFSG